MDPLEAVASVRNKMGYSPLANPMFIQGEAPEPPPYEVPEVSPEEAALMRQFDSDGGSDAEEEAPQAAAGQASSPPSPLIPRLAAPAVVQPPTPDTIVWGSQATTLGQNVELESGDVEQIKLIVLRRAKARMDALVKQASSGSRAAQSPSSGDVKGQEPAVQAPKKRGRPKGSKNKPKEKPDVPVDPAQETRG